MRRVRLLLVLSLFLVVAAPPAASALQAGIAPSRFQSAQACASCHGWLFGTWSDSMHSKALSDPLYKRKLEEADRATGGKLSDFCNDCHGPVASATGQLKGGDVVKLGGAAAESVTCDYCHQVTSLGSPLANTSGLLTPDGVKRAQFNDARSPAHKTAYSAIHRSAEFCGSCHDVNHPGNGMHLETAYSEWKKSPYATRGVVCQDCHMAPQAGTAAAGAPERDRIYMMSFVGANSGLGPKQASEQMLRSAASMELVAPEKASSDASVTVRIKNVGAGHYLPTGLTEVRQMWLEVRFLDVQGKEVAKNEHRYGTVLKDAKGRHPVELWEAVGVYSDDRIPPEGESVSTFPVPQESGYLSVEATLYYRSASEELAKDAGVELPTVTIASAKKEIGPAQDLKTGEAQAAAKAEPLPQSSGGLLLPAFLAVLVVAAAGVWILVLRRIRRTD